MSDTAVLHELGTARDRLSRLEWLAALRAYQADRWQQGQPLYIEEYVLALPALSEDREALIDLICSEFLLREARGEQPQPEEYLRRFPDYSAQLEQHFALHAAFRPAAEPEPAPDTRSLRNDRSEVQEEGDQDGPAGPLPAIPGYEIVAELGRGGMGVVYQARQLQPPRPVALKMILAGVHAGTRALARFRNEAEALARLQHPNIVQVYEVGEHAGLPYFSLEYCAGGSLARELDGTPRLAAESAATVEVLARAVDAAHQAHVVHRDLKPGNVLRTADGRMKVSDFGLAKRLDTEAGPTQPGVILGTPSYMAPEQAAGKGKEAGPAADIYALGAILYELLTGRPPFRGTSPMDTVLQVLNDEPVPPRRLQPKVPRDLETICLKCLHKQPSHRYASAVALADDLARWQRGEPIQARPIRWPERGWMWCKRKPVLAALSATLLLAVLIGTPTVVWLWQRAEMDRAQAEHERDVSDATVMQILRWVNQHCQEIDEGRELDAPGCRPARLRLLEEARRLCEELRIERQDHPALRAEIAHTWSLLGRITHDVAPGPRARDAVERGRVLYEQLVAEEPQSFAYRLGLASGWLNVCRAAKFANDRPEALRCLDESVRLIQALLAEVPSAAEVRVEYGMALLTSISILPHPEDRERNRVQALRLLEEVVAEHPQRIAWVSQLSNCYSHCGEVLRSQHKYAEVVQTCLRHRDLLARLPAADQQRVSVRRQRAMCENDLGLTWLQQHYGRYDPAALRQAERPLLTALQLRRQLWQEEPDATTLLGNLAVTTKNYGCWLAAGERPAEAIKVLQESLDLLEKWEQANPGNMTLRNEVAGCRFYLGREYRKHGQPVEAFRLLRHSARTYRTMEPGARWR